jgi:hypothetical protein
LKKRIAKRKRGAGSTVAAGIQAFSILLVRYRTDPPGSLKENSQCARFQSAGVAFDMNAVRSPTRPEAVFKPFHPSIGAVSMSTTEIDILREATRATREHRASIRDASAVAEATLVTWQQVAARLAPVIGARGVDVLFGRALHLTSSAFPWLAIAWDHGDRAALLSILKSRLAGRETAAAAAASHALFATFTELLTALIGASLADSLLGPVAASAVPGTPPEQERTS